MLMDCELGFFGGGSVEETRNIPRADATPVDFEQSCRRIFKLFGPFSLREPQKSTNTHFEI